MFGYYARKAIPFILLQRPTPMILGLSITDRCNLSCRQCRIANTGQGDMPFPVIQEKLHGFHSRGYRELYLTGGEPMLWRHGATRLEDVIRQAREIGFFHVHLYTNGTLPLDSAADVIWVGVDGLKETYARLRGDHFDLVMRHIRDSSHRRLLLIFTINNVNKHEIEAFLEFATTLNVRGVSFYFHTPYYGKDELFVPATERADIIDRLIDLQDRGLPVMNSRAGLQLLQTGRWPRPNASWTVADAEGDHVCCRHQSPEVCADCGYATCTDVVAVQRLRPSALHWLWQLR